MINKNDHTFIIRLAASLYVETHGIQMLNAMRFDKDAHFVDLYTFLSWKERSERERKII